MYETTNTEFLGTDNVKFPSISVIVPIELLPFSVILAPIIVSPLLSNIDPVTFILSCA